MLKIYKDKEDFDRRGNLRDNGVTQEYLNNMQLTLEEVAESLVNCEQCFNCKECYKCYNCVECAWCAWCSHCIECEDLMQKEFINNSDEKILCKKPTYKNIAKHQRY